MRGSSGIGPGSLLSLESAIASEIERERQAHLSSLQRVEDIAEALAELARTQAWGPEFWDVLGDQIYFVGEASKGMRLLDIM
jgi:hypothetical protein